MESKFRQTFVFLLSETTTDTLLNNGKVSVKRLETLLFFENSGVILHATTVKTRISYD